MFTGKVIGYQGFGMSGIGGAVLQVEPDADVPTNVPTITRIDSTHVLCAGDWRPVREFVEQFKGEQVDVRLDDLGLFPQFYPLSETEEGE